MLFIATTSAILGALMLVFHIEKRRGVRYAEAVRRVLDRTAMRVFVWHERTKASFQSSAARQTAHYLLHVLLVATSSVFRIVSAWFDELIRVNRSLARRATTSSREVERHLTEMMAHKKRTSLSDIEKRAHKERAIGGRLG